MARTRKTPYSLLAIVIVGAVFWLLGAFRWATVGETDFSSHAAVPIRIVPVDPHADTTTYWPIFRFDHVNEMDNWFYDDTRVTERWEIVDATTGDGAAVFSVQRDDLAEIALLTLPRDWSDFDTLVVALDNRSKREFQLVLTAADYYDIDSYRLRNDAHIDTLILAPGPSIWRIPVARFDERLDWSLQRKSIHFEWCGRRGEALAISEIALQRPSPAVSETLP